MLQSILGTLPFLPYIYVYIFKLRLLLLNYPIVQELKDTYLLLGGELAAGIATDILDCLFGV
jgi:hypothetical protein